MNLNEVHGKAYEVRDANVDEKGGKFAFAKSFMHLGSRIYFMQDDNIDSKNRVIKAAKSMVALKCTWDTK